MERYHGGSGRAYVLIAATRSKPLERSNQQERMFILQQLEASHMKEMGATIHARWLQMLGGDAGGQGTALGYAETPQKMWGRHSMMCRLRIVNR